MNHEALYFENILDLKEDRIRNHCYRILEWGNLISVVDVSYCIIGEVDLELGLE